MVKMVRNDIVFHPTEQQVNILNAKKTRVNAQSVVSANKMALEEEQLDDITENEMNAARQLLNEEIEVVKRAMAHGDLPIEVYTRVWEECYGQVRL